ncbi:DUF2855 family protein [Sneathiella sp. P13V-1]|uniref:DUF2855 family protein n=1 Tax=Sneathiella sp. P13V-1 TaxID=2697366 RepID=UPI00187B7407|nr:DUF2855 family protein [Sneathiella sp. P13V-1]MBE7635289.1 DUF2855 family protein [Sneathiella sp. P13V-1]
MSFTFDVQKDDLTQSRMTTSEANSENETDNSVWVKTEKFAFSANNITYAAFGRSMSYWDIFPRDEDWGNIPVWGNATVIKSNRDDIKVGQRLFGVFPMATEAMLNLMELVPGFMLENSEHRSTVSPVYNRYTLIPEDKGQMPENAENATIIFRPLFITAYLLALHLQDNKCFGAKQIVMTSASSKTAICLSHYLKDLGVDVEVVGLTSPKNKSFVANLGSYDDAVTYDDLSAVAGKGPAVIVDFAGDPELIEKLKANLTENFIKAIGIGAADWQASENDRNLPDEDMDFFFAPIHINQRTKDWGPVEFQKRMAGAWMSLLPEVIKWIQIKQLSGPENIQEVYVKMLNNQIDPTEGYVLSF